MSTLIYHNVRAELNSFSAIAKFLLGFILIYGALEVMARLLGDALPTENALLITGVVLMMALVVEMGLFQQRWPQVLTALGLGWRALGIALLISALQLAAYPLISWLTGYRWTLPANWVWAMVGIFALHGMAEEVLYRG